ncbi:ankyrin repeat domain-containing protein [Tropicimonas sediminicola]|uniref:Ankyrin repeat-containing protein n=1 Tax=Tropicimonas sediminicola TaxID=1031541 RepID=A0A239CDH5_9RHOB|nr:ankyrin repeat domain-containing protein [Tropicimonas sediminicola]SNS18296.1 Ankyrin repeat-containing protein [Tropicimonas sediminicola]
MKSLEQLRRDAKALKKAHLAGAPEAALRLAAHPSRSAGALQHADYLHVIAQEQGFASWPRLKLAAETEGLDRAARIQRLKIALHNGQTWVAERLLEETPDLADGLFALQVVLLNRAEVARMLAEDPARATREFGPRRPMLHLAFSRWIHARPERADDMLAIARMLVDHGASVNDTCPVGPGNPHRLSALYGAIGHADNMVLAAWLLEQGADPNDGESLYHATELGHHQGLKLLLAHGADPKGTNALLRAMDFNDHAAVRVLLDHGARADDFDGTHVGGERPWVVPALHQAARRMCDAEMVELLLRAGADPARRFLGATPYAFARVFGNRALAGALEALGPQPPLTPVETALAAAADDQPAKGPAGEMPEAYADILRMILHLPGKLEHVRRLVALGLHPDRPDAEGLTPVQVAGWEGLPEVMAFFLAQSPDLTHVNGYGGGLLDTIVHGSENCPARADRDHVRCAELALEAGAPLRGDTIRGAGDEAMSASLQDWAEAHADRVAG